MKRSRQIEYLIIGGGPAGLAAAIALAAVGREVVVVERTDYSGPRMGETLPPTANSILERLGMTSDLASASYLRCPGTVCCWGRNEPRIYDYLFDPDGDGLHLDRAAFDAALASKACDAGATILIRNNVLSCHLRDSVWNVNVASPQGERHFQALTLIDAAGRRPWPGRPSRRQAFDRQVALVGMFEIEEHRKSIDRRTYVEAVSSGWWYSASLPNNRLAVAYFTEADLLHGRVENRAALWSTLMLDTHLTRDRLDFARPLCDLRVVPASSTIADPIASLKYIAVGDAASTIDPLSSQGILYALISGLAAAEALVDPAQSHAVQHYSRVIVARFQDDLSTRQRFCQSEIRWPDSPFWRRRVRSPEWQ